MSTQPLTTPSDSLRPEATLLLACARTHLRPEHTECVRTLLAGRIDWAWLLQAASRHRTAPLLYRNLSQVSRDSVPEDTMNTLGEHFKANALRNLVLTRHLIQALRALDADGVTAIPFKGPALAELAYGDLSLRQFVDLDILVQARDVPKATGTLVAMGYSLVLESNAPKAAYLQSMHHYNFARADVEASLELHWRITERYFDSSALAERLWHRLQSSTLAGAAVQRMADEDLLLVLCVHAAKHGWESLAQVCDIAELVRARADTLNGQQTLSEARALGFERVLLLGLFLANALLGQPLPKELDHRIGDDPALPPLASRLQEALFAEDDSPVHPGESERICFFRLHLQMRERFRDKMLHCLRVAFIPSQDDWEWVSLPPRLSFLYYVLRPIRLLVKHLRKAPKMPA